MKRGRKITFGAGSRSLWSGLSWTLLKSMMSCQYTLVPGQFSAETYLMLKSRMRFELLLRVNCIWAPQHSLFGVEREAREQTCTLLRFIAVVVSRTCYPPGWNSFEEEYSLPGFGQILIFLSGSMSEALHRKNRCRLKQASKPFQLIMTVLVLQWFAYDAQLWCPCGTQWLFLSL